MADITKEEWLAERLAYFKTLQAPAEHQRLMLVLGVKEELTGAEKKQLAAAFTLEKIDQKRQRSAEKFRLVTQDPESAKAARDHRMFQAAGLLSMAGLLEKDGTMKQPADALLGALLGLAEVQDARRWEAWAVKGAALLVERQAKKGSRKKEDSDAAEVDRT
jgi:hypothetical protein